MEKIKREENSGLCIKQDYLCQVPLFWGFHEGKLFVSNKFSEVAQSIIKAKKKVTLSLQGTIEFLLDLSHTPHTVLEGVYILPERAKLLWQDTLPQVVLPESIPLPTPTFKNPHLFFSLVEKTFSQKLKEWEEKKIGFEISGGIDSCTPLALYREMTGQTPLAFTILLPRPNRKSQKEKLKAIEKSFGAKFITYSLSVSRDFVTREFLEGTDLFYPQKEIYSWPLEKLARKAQKEGIKIMVTGIGGDEVFLPDNLEKRKFHLSQKEKRIYLKKLPRFFTLRFLKKAELILKEYRPLPHPLVGYSSLESNLARNNIYLAKRIFPYNFWQEPELFRTGRSFVPEWRENKRLLREYYVHKRWPREISHPQVNENFASFFEESLKNKGGEFIISKIKRSWLAQLGWVDKKELLESFENWRKDKEKINPFWFYKIAVLEEFIERGKALLSS